MKTTAPALGLILALHAAPASAAVPEFGTREGELACVGLMNLGLLGASASQPSNPQVISAVAMTFGYYLGRLSKVDPDATKQDIDAAMAKLTLEEKNAYVDRCLKKAAEGMRPALE